MMMKVITSAFTVYWKDHARVRVQGGQPDAS
jgi:hypothetical protein